MVNNKLLHHQVYSDKQIPSQLTAHTVKLMLQQESSVRSQEVNGLYASSCAYSDAHAHVSHATFRAATESATVVHHATLTLDLHNKL